MAISSQSLEFPVLVADIGGTNARFAIVESANSEICHYGKVSTAAYESIEAAIIDRVIATCPQKPRSAILAVAGPVTGDKIALTNAPWVIEPQKINRVLGLSAIAIVNDFEAQALALPVLQDTDLIKVGGGVLQPDSTKFVLGPGTGLGAATMIHANGMWIPVPGEGGHVELGPLTDEEYEIWPHIARNGGRIGAEQIICGRGLINLARAVMQVDGEMRQYESPSDVPNAADDGDEVAQKVLRLFAAALGRVAGDFALTTLARGGVYLAGGIPPKIAGWLNDGNFRRNFEAKAPHEAIMKTIPTFIVNHHCPALDGLAGYARNPQSYLLELKGRAWYNNLTDA
nr:glucokinase [Pseudovibrio stylochi]